MKTLTEKVNKDETREAYVLAKMETTHFGLLLGDLDTTKKDLEECGKYLDGFDSVDPQINASFLRVSADYYKVPWPFIFCTLGKLHRDEVDQLTLVVLFSLVWVNRSRRTMLSTTRTRCCT